MPASDPSDRALVARAAAHASWARTADPSKRTAPARAAFADRFEREARELHPGADDATIARVAQHLRTAYFTGLALKSAQARRRRKLERPAS